MMGSNAEWFKFYWQDLKICGKVSGAKNLSLHHRRGVRDPQDPSKFCKQYTFMAQF